MPSTSSHEITRLLREWCAGSHGALYLLLPLVYEELHRAARRQMAREDSGHTLQTTALIHEVYLRLVKLPEIDWQNRAHFYAVCSMMMRRILTDLARNAVLKDAAAYRKILSRTPIGRCGEASEVASVAAFLASDDASYITGQTIYPDGGRLVLNYTVPVAED